MARVVAHAHLKTGPGDAQIERDRPFPSPREFVGKSLLKKPILAGGQQPSARPGPSPSTEPPKSQVSAKLLQGQPPPPEEREYRQREEPDYCESTRHFISAFHQHPSPKSPVCSACRAGGVDTASAPLAGRGDCSCR